jgi:DNA modification methylase
MAGSVSEKDGRCNVAKAKSTWRNRIVGYSEEEPDQLLANPSNWRIHPINQQNALSGVLKEIGLVQNVVANRTTGHLVDGHLRVMLAMRENQPVVPVTWVELSEEEERLILASLDPLAAMATADAGALDALLSSVQSGEAAVQAMLASLAESAGIYPPKDDADAEPQIDRAEELREQWGVELGQMWRLPSRTEGQEHRIICGDCTIAAVVERVMGGEKAHMMFTDPPYGVDYTGGHFHSGDVNIKRERERLAGDKTDMYTRFLPVVLPFVDGPCYVWFASSVGKPVYDAVLGYGCEIHAMIVWNKTNATYAAMNAQYKQRHEPLLYFKPNGSTLRWTGPTNECTVWDIPRDSINEYHPTQKPVALASRAIGNHDAPVVADFFAGSGSTIIAAENLSRQCRAVEISPAYVAVALQRYSDAFGITPELID